MRLLKVSSVDSPFGLEVVDVDPSAIPPYAILSHTWTGQEVVYTDIAANTAKTKRAYHKIEYTCRQALSDGYDYAWADNCCIDKSSSAELSEAINSMYEWYRRAETCYVYLADCPKDADVNDAQSNFAKSRWFTRCWTLQELIAPSDLTFYSQDWVEIGKKRTMSKALSDITGIDEDIVNGSLPPESASIAKRMSWAACRQATRPEDVAYSLMGLFDVNMPMLYGEGAKAFLRLQEEIMKLSNDHSLFAWTDTDASSDSHHSLLARSPANFIYSNSILPYEDWEPRTPYSITNRGLQIDLRLNQRGVNIYVAALDCPCPPDYEDNRFLGIYLKKVSDGDEQYVRVKVGRLAKVHERGNMRSIYVKQKTRDEEHGLYPNHVLQLRKGPDPNEYSVTSVVCSPQDIAGLVEHLRTTRATPHMWLPGKYALVYRASKAANQFVFGIVFKNPDGKRLLVMVGSGEGLKVAFSAMEPPFSTDSAGLFQEDKIPTFESIKRTFVPTMAGGCINLVHHRVLVEAQPSVHKGTKYYDIDIDITPIKKVPRPIEAIQRASLAVISSALPRKSENAHEEGEEKPKKRWKSGFIF